MLRAAFGSQPAAMWFVSGPPTRAAAQKATSPPDAVDFLVRDVGLGMNMAGWHWSVVGLSAFLGPLVTAALASRIGISATLLIVFVLLGLGIGGPAVLAVGAVLWLSSML